ncbi:MAG: FAD-dependent oxidoreductase [bacterium]|nr:FAD-dependent oxidoreductase [bacterium]
MQSTIIRKAREHSQIADFTIAKPTGKRVAIVGCGPAGLGAAAVLAQAGCDVTLFDAESEAGGMCRWIPSYRLDPAILDADLNFIRQLGNIEFRFHESVEHPETLLSQGYHAVIVATGLPEPLTLPIPNIEYSTTWKAFLKQQDHSALSSKKVVVIGGGAIAVDCAITAIRAGSQVTMIALEKLSELPLTEFEWKELRHSGVQLIERTKVNAILVADEKITGVETSSVELPDGLEFSPRAVVPVEQEPSISRKADFVVIAIGARNTQPRVDHPNILYAGDCSNGPTTVVEAVAAGKNAAQNILEQLHLVEARPIPEKPVKSRITLLGRKLLPVPLTSSFFGRTIASPFLLSAAPPTDGYEQMAKAYRAGWPGGVMKTAFDDVPIHIPAEYMFIHNKLTYGNCDNVSGHSLQRVCGEIEKLVREFPDRLTIASTGGPVSGDDEYDRNIWQSNTRKLEAAGAMGIEYSLSCPQGGDGTHGDIVSQNAELTAKIIDWVMKISDPNVPKLFKLTGAVTAIQPILQAIHEVLTRYPNKKAGVTLANSFPALEFRPGHRNWDDGYVVGLSGDGVTPISNLTLAKAAGSGVTISGNGGPMDYKSAANFLALGASTVQFCTIVLKYGYGIIDELHSGLSYLLQDRGFLSISELIGCALPFPILQFDEITATKKISAVDPLLCKHCGNCTRCPYLAIELTDEQIPVTDPSKCIGCSLCMQKCFSGALYMRPRSEQELSVLREH